MRVIRELKLDGKVIGQVKELTVAEIRAWLASNTGGGDLVDSMLFEEVSVSDLTRLTSLTTEEIDALTPAEIDSFMPELKEINARFFAMREKTAALGRQILAAQSKSASET